MTLASASARRAALGVALLCAFSGCVLTTFEGQSEPPRIAPPPAPIATAKRDGNGPEAPKPLDPALLAAQPTEISARHLLVAYKGGLRASPGIGRSKAEARARAEEAQKRAATGEDFVTLVKQYSDEPGAAERGGDLGKFERSSMVPAFGNAAFALKVGEVSQVVETQFGYHVILRTQ